MSNIREVARAAGVSVATVSRSLSQPEKVSPATLKKVKDAIDAVGYRPNMLARSFRSARSYALMVLIPDIKNPFFSKVIQAIEDTAQKRGYAVLLGNTREIASREEEYIKRVETKLADGVIQLRPQSMTQPPPEIPWVNACGCEGTPMPSLRIDNVRAAESVIDHLIELGHKRIAVATGKNNNLHTVDRLQGYHNSMERAGLPAQPEWIIEGDYSMHSGQLAAQKILTMSTRPTALFCMNDEMAIGAIQAFSSAGMQVPKDISVTGFDDIVYAEHWSPALTTVAQPANIIGRLATDMLIDIIEGKNFDDFEEVLPTTLLLRESSGPPK